MPLKLQNLSLAAMGFLAILVVQGCQRSASQAELPLGADPEFRVPNSQREEYATQTYLDGRKKELDAFGTEMIASGARIAAKVARGKRGENFMISPFSLAECLGMARLGASGKTEAELGAFLAGAEGSTAESGGLSSEEMATKLRSLRGTLATMMAADVIRQANGIWISDQAKIKPEFKAKAEELFDAKIANTTFPNPGEAQVNAFVKEQTRGKIPSILQGTTADTRVVLVNAISFLDRWVAPFSKENTKREDFTLPSGEKVQQELMHKAVTFARYTQVGGTKGISLDFESKFKMIFLLGPEGVAPEACFANLSKIHAVLNDYESNQEGEIKIPKWTSEFSWDIRAAMVDAGLTQPVSIGKADFSKMSDEQLFIQNAIQKTMIRVDEEGAEAVAVTAVDAAKSAAVVEEDKKKPFNFIANRPFAYAIVDIYGVPYFMGVVNDPR